MTIHRGQLALLKSAVAAAITIAITYIGLEASGIRVNASPSLPIGLYIITPNHKAALIEFCPGGPFGSLSVQRAYRGSGSCPDGGEPLMKPIVASAGDVVYVSAHGIFVNQLLVPNSGPLTVDTKQRSLWHWPTGRYRVAADEVWVISSFNGRSFDSRYMGPIEVTRIRQYLRPLLTE